MTPPSDKTPADVAREIAEGNMVEDEKGMMVVDNWANLIDDIAIAIERERAARLPSEQNFIYTLDEFWHQAMATKSSSSRCRLVGHKLYDWLASQMSAPKAEEARVPSREEFKKWITQYPDPNRPTQWECYEWIEAMQKERV